VSTVNGSAENRMFILSKNNTTAICTNVDFSNNFLDHRVVTSKVGTPQNGKVQFKPLTQVVN
jgi:hypothetical protein